MLLQGNKKQRVSYIALPLLNVFKPTFRFFYCFEPLTQHFKSTILFSIFMKEFNLEKIIALAIKEGAKRKNLTEEEVFEKLMKYLQTEVKTELEKLNKKI